MLITPSPITITSHESDSVLSKNVNNYGFFCHLSKTSEPSMSAVSSMSSITLDPALTLDNTSVSSDKTASPILFSHDVDIEDNFINPYSRSLKTNIQYIVSPGTETLDNDNQFISISEKSRNISVKDLFLSKMSESKSSNYDLERYDIRPMYENALIINAAGEIVTPRQIENLASESITNQSKNVRSKLHKTFYTLSVGMVISGIALILVQNSSKENQNLGLSGLLLILSGITTAMGTYCYEHHTRECENALGDEHTPQMGLPN